MDGKIYSYVTIDTYNRDSCFHSRLMKDAFNFLFDNKFRLPDRSEVETYPSTRVFDYGDDKYIQFMVNYNEIRRMSFVFEQYICVRFSAEDTDLSSG